MTQWIIVDNTCDLTGTGTHYEDQADFELMELHLFLPPKCWG